MSNLRIRPFRPGDEPAMYHVCLKTGDFGADGEPFYRDDPDALGRIFVGPYLAYEPELALALEDDDGVCGYAMAVMDSKRFYARYESEWRPKLCADFPMPQGDPAGWTRSQMVHSWYHSPDYFCPEPYAEYPAHLHIDLVDRAQGFGFGRKLMTELMDMLRRRGSPGVHLGVAMRNTRGRTFYQHLGFKDLAVQGDPPDGCYYMGVRLNR
jgi:ribosomal protein S18 acetylase RimI-like enzyme